MFQPTCFSLLKGDTAGSGIPRVGGAFKAPSRDAAEGRSLEQLPCLSPPQRAAGLGRRDPSTAQQLSDPAQGTPDSRSLGSGLPISGRQGKVGALRDPRK